MSNYHVEPADKTAGPRRRRPSRRSATSRSRGCRGGQLLRGVDRGRGRPVGARAPRRDDRVPVAEPASGFGAPITVGTLDGRQGGELTPADRRGLPGLLRRTRASFVILIDPARQEFLPGEDTTGDGTALNVRALYQRCPHLGCKPNPCLKNFWLECPCHGSRYDRLGTSRPSARPTDRRRAAWTGSRSSSTPTAC